MTQLDPFEFWLLSHLATCGVPLGAFGRRDLEAVLNGPGHGRDLEGLVAGIGDLLARDFVAVRRNEEPVAVSPDRLRLALCEPFSPPPPDAHVLRLTEIGGAAWETWAQPSWSRFVGEEPMGDDRWLLRGVNSALLLQYANVLADLHDVEPPRTADLREIANWQPTYWKTLPLGVELTMRLPALPRSWRNERDQRRDANLVFAKNYFDIWWRWFGL